MTYSTEPIISVMTWKNKYMATQITTNAGIRVFHRGDISLDWSAALIYIYKDTESFNYTLSERAKEFFNNSPHEFDEDGIPFPVNEEKKP